MQHLQSLVPFLLSSTVLSTQYPGQIIAVVGYDDTVMQAAYQLYDKNPEGSQVVSWQLADSTEPAEGYQFVAMERTILGGRVSLFGIQRQPRLDRQFDFTPIYTLPHGGRIQVVGHGRINTETDQMEIGGMDASQISAALRTLPTYRTAGAIKRVSLVGCGLGGQNARGFSEKVLRSMSNIVDEVSSRTGLVSIDSSGRKVYGALNYDDNIQWKSTPETVTKEVIRLNNENAVEKINDYVASRIELEETGEGVNPDHVKLSKDDVFNVISSVAEEHFQTVPVHPNWNTRVENKRLVRVLDNQGMERDEQIDVREFSSYAQLTQEIKHWGTKGFEFQSYDKVYQNMGNYR